MSIGSVSTDNLISAGRDVSTPFEMTIRGQSGPMDVRFEEILRLLPGKRIVARASIGGNPILIKLFLGRTATRYAARERDGIEMVSGADVRTVDYLWSAPVPGGRMIAFEYLKNACSLNDLWRGTRSDGERSALLARVMLIMAKLHEHGVLQKDIHLANFLLAGSQIHTIDGGGISRESDGPLPEQTSISNLAWLFAQFLARYDELIPDALVHYEAGRGWEKQGAVHKRLSQQLLDEVARCREQRKRNYIDKSFRDCTRFVCQSSFRRFMVCERRSFSPEMQRFIDDPDSYINNGEMLKDGNSATVALIRVNDRALVVKRYNMKSFWHRVRRAFRNSRAWVSWSNAHRLEFLGIPALKPVALIESRLGPLRSRAYFVSEYIEGGDALQFLAGSAADKDLSAVGAILQELADSRISHGDLKASNFLMSRTGPVMVDLDAMQEHKSPDSFERAFRNDLQRFMDNWQDTPGLSGRFSTLLSDLYGRYGVPLPRSTATE